MSEQVMTAPVIEPVQEKKGIPGSTLKIIAIIAMFIDHTAAVIFDRYLTAHGMAQLNPNDLQGQLDWLSQYGVLYYADMIMRLIGRLGFPLFCFLLVEGFDHTRSKWKYAGRLCAFALISEIPFNLSFNGTFFFSGYQNVFFTLFLGFVFMILCDLIYKHMKKGVLGVIALVVGILAPGSWLSLTILDLITNLGFIADKSFIAFGIIYSVFVIATVIWMFVRINKRGLENTEQFAASLVAMTVLMYAADLLKTDYSGLGVLTIAVMYAFRRTKTKEMAMGSLVLTIFNFIECTAFFAMIPVSKYNGKRGLKLKYFFYAFYPVHLLLLHLITVLMGVAPAVQAITFLG